MLFFPLKIHQNRCRLGLFPRHTGELTALPQIPKLVSRGPLCGRRGIEGSGGKDQVMGEGREEKGGSWGNSALVVGG